MEPDEGEGTSVAVSPAAQCWCGARSRLPRPACSRSDKSEGSGAQGLCHHHLGLGAGLGAVGHPHVHRTGTLVVPTPSFGMGNLTITDATLFRPVNHLFIFIFFLLFLFLLWPHRLSETASDTQAATLQCSGSRETPMAAWKGALSSQREPRHEGEAACVCLCQHITKHIVRTLSSGTNTCSGRKTAVPARAQGQKQRQYYLLGD